MCVPASHIRQQHRNAGLLLTKIVAPTRCFASELMVLFVLLNSTPSTAVLKIVTENFVLLCKEHLLKSINDQCVLVLEQRPGWSWIKGRFALELNGILESAYLVCIVQTWYFKVHVVVVRLDQRSRYKNMKNYEIFPDIVKICFWIL